MTAISDPERPNRRDRRQARKLIDTAFAEGRLTAADRSLRMERIDAAHSRGDLAMITRDLSAPTATNLGRALDHSTMATLRVDTPRPSIGAGTSAPWGTKTPTVDLSGMARRVKLIILIAIIGFIATCGLGIAGFVVSIVQTATSDPTPARSAPAPTQAAAVNLHTAEGWSGLMDAIEEKSGTTQVYDLVVYPQYAMVGLDGDGAVERAFYRNGAWQDTSSSRSPAIGTAFDLAEIDPTRLAQLPGETARHFDLDEPSGTYLLVNAYRPGNPRITVYVQGDAGSQYRSYGLDGEPLP